MSEDHPVKALSVKQPWAHAILSLGKDVENRGWPTHYRGPLLIHAGKVGDRSPTFAALGLSRGDCTFGALVGVVDLVDCARDVDSPWASPGAWHWVLESPRVLDPIPCSGRLRVFDIPHDVRESVSRALSRL